MKISVARFEKYPQDEPVGYAVGFNVECEENGRVFYTDTVVPFTDLEENISDEDITKKAFKVLNSSISVEYDKIKTSRPLIGSSIGVDVSTGDITINAPIEIPTQVQPEIIIPPEVVVPSGK